MSLPAYASGHDIQRQIGAWDLLTAAGKVSEGLPVGWITYLQDKLEISRKEVAELLMINPRTLARRLGDKRLQADESERAWRLARLLRLAAEVLNGEQEAAAWMKEENYALGERRPLDLARTDPGMQLVERTLRQIEYGMPV